MSTYRAPLADMEFVMNELAGLSQVAALPGFEDATPDTVSVVLEEASRFASEVLAPLNATGDREGSKLLPDGTVKTPDGFKAAYGQFVEGGWNGVNKSAEYGGQHLPQLVAAAIEEMWHAANMAFDLCPLLTQGAIDAIELVGTPEQKARYLPKMVGGEWTGTMNLTEPQAGSDLAAVRTRAEPQGDGTYKLFGQKIFITYGEHDFADNIIHLVLARTPSAPEGVKGISLFLVPKFLVNPDGSLGRRNDVRCVSLEHKLGIHASPTCVLAFGDNEGAVGTLIGDENRGMECMFTMMNNARLNVGLQGVAIAERAYQQARDYARTRIQGKPIGVKMDGALPIIHHPDVRRMLLSMKAQTEAMRALAYVTAGAIDRARRHPDAAVRLGDQRRADLLIPVVKAWCTDLGVEVASTGVQVHGGMGYIEETGAAQHFRDSRIAPIYEGTNGIQANDLVSRKLGRDRGEAARELIGEMRASLGELDAPELAVLRQRLTDATAALDTATAYLVTAEPALAAAGSAPYLNLCGTVLGGWLMARVAAAALQRHDAALSTAKLATARFYAEHFLARAQAYLPAVMGGATVVDFDPDWL